LNFQLDSGPSEPLDPVLEARRKKFAAAVDQPGDKKISLKTLKETIGPINKDEYEAPISLDKLSDESEDSDNQEGR